jgi:hypothetical protein
MENPSTWLQPTQSKGGVPHFDVPIGIRHRTGNVATHVATAKSCDTMSLVLELEETIGVRKDDLGYG